MYSIHSSWNIGRFINNDLNKPHKVRVARKPYVFASYRDNEVRVIGARGKVRFTLRFDRKIVSAMIKEDHLVVETADAVIRHYDVMTRELVVEIRPTPPAGGASYPLAA